MPQPSDQPGSKLSRALSLRYLMRHPIAFRDYWVPQVYQRGFLQRYYFMPAVFALDDGDTTVRAGRGSGKSVGLLEPELVRRPWNRPGEETILTSLRRTHIVDRMERIISYFSVGFLRLYIRRVVRQPYMIELSNGHIIYGLCVDLATPVMDPITGCMRPLGEFITEDRVTSLTPAGRVETSVIDQTVVRGLRDTVYVETASGREIVVTPEHPLLSDEGWVRADACEGKRIALPVRLPLPAEPVDISDEEIDLMAILIAEGTLAAATIEIYNEDPEIIRRAEAGARAIGCVLKWVPPRKGRYTISPRPVIWRWLEDRGIARVRAHRKEIPPCVFRFGQHALGRFLSVLWMTDGFVNSNGPAIHMATQTLLVQLQHLLLRIGVQSGISYRQQMNGSPSWKLAVYSDCFESFREAVPLWGNREKMLAQILNGHRHNGSGWPRASAVADVILPAWIARARGVRGKPVLPDSVGVETARRRGHLKASPKRVRGPERLRFMLTANPVRVKEWAELSGAVHEMISVWTSPDIWWDPVVAVHPAGQRVVGDISVPPNRTFVAADIIVHNSAGDDPESKMLQGKHASTVDIEEAHQFPLRAWAKLQGARDPRGSTVFMTGVPDGRLDTPFRHSDSRYKSFEGRRFQISRRWDPNFTQQDKATFSENLGGEQSDLFRQEVDAEWGNPAWSAWDMEALLRCTNPELDLVMIQISGRKYREHGLTPGHAIEELPGPPGPGPIRLAMDVGYSQPSELGVLRFWHDRWSLIARIRLFDRMEHSDQAAIVDAVGALYDAESIAIDTTEGEGRAIVSELEESDRWLGKVIRVTFTEKYLSGWAADGEEIWETAKPISVRQLRGMLHRGNIELPLDSEIQGEFNQEIESRNKDGVTRLVTPPTVHIPEMMRVFAFTEFLANPPRPPESSVSGVFDIESGDPLWSSPRLF